MNISWYLNRLKTMSVPELAFRMDQMLNRRINKMKFQGYFPEKSLGFLPEKILDTNNIHFPSESTHFEILGLDWDYAEFIDWHKDIRTQGVFPRIFCRNVNTRSDENGIAKYVWEPNRHQFLTRLAMQYKTTGNRKYLKLFQTILESWIVENPYLIGVNWYSNIEVNVRLITWFLCWEILDVNSLMEQDASFDAFVKTRWIPSIYLHCKYSHDFPSKFTSANNHRISEGVGLFIASAYWKFPESPKWNREAKKVVETELIKQHAASGVNREETSEYIQFITDFFLIALVVGEKTSNKLSDASYKMFRLMLEYIYNLMDVNGKINHYGDGDDGRTFILEEDKEHFNNFSSLLSSGTILYGDAAFKARSNGFDLKNQVLFGAEGEQKFDSVKDVLQIRTSKFYREDGHFIFRKEEPGDREIMLHFDVAPLGYLGIAAHGHADVLSFYMGVDGKFIFIDPGTYSYHTDMDWRNYFISTLAHNTICVDGKNQAFRGGPTMWTDHYIPKVVEVKETSAVESVTGSHNGYESSGVKHTRRIDFDRKRNLFLITDSIEITDQKEHLIQIPFHLHPEVQIEDLGENRFLLVSDGARNVQMTVDKKLAPAQISGQSHPILGWYSPAFYKKSPCPVIFSELTTSQSFDITTEIQIDENPD
ncbi:MAG: alginate lyase family protein [Bacteroidia bacterium]|nr:alginate lyase family protein [Bacteroidia bacterium]